MVYDGHDMPYYTEPSVYLPFVLLPVTDDGLFTGPKQPHAYLVSGRSAAG
jgi:hypothetical protein